MNDKAWENLVDLIDSKYEIDSFDNRVEPLEDNRKLNKSISAIFFEKDNVKYKIERVVSPKIIDKKTFYSGHSTANRVEYVYSPDETSSKVYFYKKLDDGRYNEIEPEEFMA